MLARLLLLGERVPATAVEATLGVLASTLADCGLLAVDDGGCEAPVVVIPHDTLLIASDRPASSITSEHVPGVQGPSHTLGLFAIRRPVARALDLGTGCGIQALLLAPFAERVVATDISERALAFAELNAALNGITNVEFRHGDLLEPIAGERFGLVVSNPPYVISPDTDFVFRDSPLGGETLCERVVRGVAGVLEPGGHGVVMISWDASGPDPTARPIGWLADVAARSLLCLLSVDEAMANAEVWTQALPDPAEGAARWQAYYRARGIEAIGYGVAVLRATTETASARVVPVASTVPGQASDHLLRMLDGAAADLSDETRVGVVPTARIVSSLRLADGAWVADDFRLTLRDGLRLNAELDRETATFLRSLDGTRRLGDLTLTDASRAFVRELLAMGFVEVC
jgi:SAM-dependent methyltransferase